MQSSSRSPIGRSCGGWVFCGRNLQPRRLVEQALRDGFRMRALSLEPTLLSCELQQKHGDPFDRLLYAQAKYLGYRLLSVDRSLSKFGVHVINPR
jgi:PIN domain nuclease of toxin-antitoxin system